MVDILDIENNSPHITKFVFESHEHMDYDTSVFRRLSAALINNIYVKKIVLRIDISHILFAGMEIIKTMADAMVNNTHVKKLIIYIYSQDDIIQISDVLNIIKHNTSIEYLKIEGILCSPIKKTRNYNKFIDNSYIWMNLLAEALKMNYSLKILDLSDLYINIVHEGMMDIIDALYINQTLECIMFSEDNQQSTYMAMLDIVFENRKLKSINLFDMLTIN